MPFLPLRIKEHNHALYIFLFLTLALFNTAPSDADPHRKPPSAVKGVLDLRLRDFKNEGPVSLNGEWGFVWEKFITPEELKNKDQKDNQDFIILPGYWNNFTLKNTRLPGEGYASFSLKILLPAEHPPLAFKINDIQTAYSFFVNGKLLAQTGTVGTDKSSSVPFHSSFVADLIADGPEISVLIHVSNFHHRDGGIWENLKLGSEDDIRKIQQNTNSFEIFLASSILIIGLYHISLFLHRKKDKTSLYFGIFCFTITVWSLLTGEMQLYMFFPELPWQVFHKMEYISFFIATPLFLMYLQSMFQDDFSPSVITLIRTAGILYSLFVLLAPAKTASYSIQTYQVLTALAGLYSFFVLAKVVIRKEKGSFILMTGFIFMFTLFINDILHSNQIIHTGYFLSSGLLVFIFSQSVLISIRFSRIYQTAENQSEELLKTNKAYKKEIEERKVLEKNLLKSNEQLERSRISIILGLAKLAEYRDEDTGSHLERIREYSRIIAEELSNHPDYQDYITEDYIRDIFHSSILHDIGKVGIPDSILLKPGELSDDEFKIIKRHPELGGNAIQNVESKINIKSFLNLGREIAYSHHEKWDGSGYPQGLKGTEIPLSARIVSLADVYDALTSERPYKKAFTHEKALEIIRKDRGTHFDPDIADAFFSRSDEINNIRISYQSV